MSKVAKGKGKTRGENGKTGKCAEEQDNKSTDSFQNYIRGDCSCFRSKACRKERKPCF